MEKTSVNTYPFVKCLSPQVIRNKYTHEQLLVSCGKCEACLKRKSSMSTLKCQLENKNHMFAKFVTLTYADEHIPRMIVEKHERVIDEYGCTHDLVFPYVYVEKRARLTGVDTLPLYNLQSLENHNKLTAKVENTHLPYLCKRDLQLFIKRLRRYYDRIKESKKIKNTEIRYYACGEYGPVHYRPHYHLILWTSDEQVRKTLPQAVRACWKLGRVSTETPRDDVSKYVAKYVNGNSYLPEVFKSAKIKPFSLHSQHLGEQIFQATKKEIYESPVEVVIKRSCIINDTNTDIYMWRSLKTYYFPRCKAYDLCTSQQRMYAYTIKDAADEYFPSENIAKQARNILDYLSDMCRYNILLTGQWHDIPQCNDMLKYFIDSCSLNPYHFGYQDYYDSAFRSLYMVLRLSKHFIEFCSDSSISKYHQTLNKIENFYSECDRLNLKNQYLDLEEFSKDWFENEEEYTLCFTLLPNEIQKTRVYRRFKANTLNSFCNSMKHKRQNDLNKVFDKLI